MLTTDIFKAIEDLLQTVLLFFNTLKDRAVVLFRNTFRHTLIQLTKKTFRSRKTWRYKKRE
jgi:hypothetical protein